MKITFIGGGNMASAMVGGLLKKGWKPGAITVVEIAAPARAQLESRLKVKAVPAIDAAAVDAACIVLAVKPQQMRTVALELAPLLREQLVVTIAAGIRVADLSRWLGGYSRIVRVMPNTPALVLAGVSGLCAGPNVRAEDRRAAERILGAVGATVWVEREDELDAVTAVSGSGPAYVFYFIEALEQAALALGLREDAARKLALETFAGAVRLALEAGEPPAELRARVTSKGGTTERALQALDADGVKSVIARAVRAAAERSRELGDELGKDR
ncbi:MAG TPA: pyrroline-5-carboxylate reductase [Burkholderiales bacterium]|nr:pyrroline-5-carboxylate reductase [Burkholderiales bacterium]